MGARSVASATACDSARVATCSGARAAHSGAHHLVLKAAKRECLSDSSVIDLRKSACILPAAEKTRSTPADEAGAAR